MVVASGMELYVEPFTPDPRQLAATLAGLKPGGASLLEQEDERRELLREIAEADGASGGAVWGDYDNDGDQDLFVANRAGNNALYRNDGDLDLAVVNWGAAPVLYLNDGVGGLTRCAAGDLGRRLPYGACLAWADFDNDGDLDLYVGSWPNSPGPGEQNLLCRNETPAAGWLRIRLEGTDSNRSAIGARITIQAEIPRRLISQIREVSAQNSFRSQNSLIQHFGLGDADGALQVVVRWSSGRVSTLSEVPANQLLDIDEAAASPAPPQI
jgi:hypothetical protein